MAVPLSRKDLLSVLPVSIKNLNPSLLELRATFSFHRFLLWAARRDR
jgi:hypothetical protein